LNRDIRARARLNRRAATAIAACLASLVAGSSSALGAGGVVAPGIPRVADVHCLTKCVSGRKATPGSTVVVKGSALEYVSRVIFRAAEGPLRVRPSWGASSRVKAVVPRDARSGRLYVVDFRGQRSNRSPKRLSVLPPSAIPVEVFPVRGPHQYWDGFGAGRGHQGMDIGAACGTRLVAARTGRVEYKAYHGAAGNYVVIDNRDSNTDFAYMHLASPASVRVGESVGAGQMIGRVGDTGNSSGCHLHFEFWVGDWYGGGHPVDPERFLRGLDRKS
jgi:murein DD-endopeptidase MepM/ murein hydrolase activator NlpD